MQLIGAIAVDDKGQFVLFPHAGQNIDALLDQLTAGADVAPALNAAKQRTEAALRERNEATSRLIDQTEKLAELAKLRAEVATLKAALAAATDDKA